MRLALLASARASATVVSHLWRHAAAVRRPLSAAASDALVLGADRRSAPPAAAGADRGSPPVAVGITTMLDKDDGLSHIGAHDKYGFAVNGIHMRGSVLVFKNFTLLWNVQRVLDVCPRNLAIAHMIRPRPDILLIGTGDRMENVNPSLYAYFSRKGIAVEALSTVRAARHTPTAQHPAARRAPPPLLSLSRACRLGPTPAFFSLSLFARACALRRRTRSRRLTF